MEITHIAHVAICVASLEKSLEFYQELLGLYTKMQQTQDKKDKNE